MLFLREHQNQPHQLSDLINWAALIAPNVVINKDGSFMSCVKYRGPDLDSSTECELVTVCARLNNVLRRLGSGWAIFAEAQRKLSSGYFNSSFPDPISGLIDWERKRLFEESSHYESTYFLTFTYLPPGDHTHKISSAFLTKSNDASYDYERALEQYQAEIKRFVGLLELLFPQVELLSDSDLLTYLHSTVSTKHHRIGMFEVPMYLDSLLCDSVLIPGFEPKLGNKHLQTVAIQCYPGKSHPGFLDALNRLSLEYRWTTRFIALDKTQAEKEISRFKRQWFAKRKGIVTLLKEVFTGTESVMADPDALNQTADADEALSELLSDSVSYGYFTAVIVLAEESAESARLAAAEVERVINSFGFVAHVEDVNSVDAWLGTIPGNVYNNVRRPLLHTLNLAHLLPISAVWAGPEKNTHLKGPPLLYAQTGGNTPFRLTTHVGDVGHTLVIGPTGSGKSVLLNLLEAQFLRYPDAQVYIFDKGGSSRILTAGIGGDFYDLGSTQSKLAFQPLAGIHVEKERVWAQEWVLALLEQENVTLTPAKKESVWKALCSLATARREERTLFGLTVLLQDESLRQALLPFTVQGPHGSLLDSTSDNLSYGAWQVFEMELLMETKSAVVPVLSYLFHRLEQRFDGSPTLLVLDEAWLFFDNPTFAGKIREWLKVLRKANVTVVFATLSLSDITSSSIATTIKESCFTKIFLPNSGALENEAKTMYSHFGLNERQIEILALATPKREYYYTSSLGHRLFELNLDDLTLAYCGRTSKDDQRKVKHLLECTRNTLDFNLSYLSELKLPWAVDFLKTQIKEQEVA